MTAPEPAPLPDQTQADEARRPAAEEAVSEEAPESAPEEKSITTWKDQAGELGRENTSIKPPAGPPIGGSPPGAESDAIAGDAGVIEGRASKEFGRRLERTSRKAQKASDRTWRAFVVLIVAAVGVVVAGWVAKNEAVWKAAATVLLVAGLVAIARAADQLGAAATATDFLRAALKIDGSKGKGAFQGAAHEDAPASQNSESAAILLARRLQQDNKLVAAKKAYELAADEDTNPDAPFSLAKIYLNEQNYAEGKRWLRKAKDRGSVEGAYLLGSLNPHGKLRAQHESLQLLQILAEAHPNHHEFWQAYYMAVRDVKGARDADIAIVRAFLNHDGNAILRLLATRAIAPEYTGIDEEVLHTDPEEILNIHLTKSGELKADRYRSPFPEAMHYELYFHAAVKLIHGKPDDSELGEKLKQALVRALQFDARTNTPTWLWQVFAIEAAYTLVVASSDRDIRRAGGLLQSVLEMKPPIPFLEDISALAVILKSAGDQAAEPLVSEIIRARPGLGLAGANCRDSDVRESLFKALISAMVPGVDVTAPVPASPALASKDICDLIGRAAADLSAKETGD